MKDKIVDVDFEVIDGPLRVGDEHPKHRGWFFTGEYDEAGDPLFRHKHAAFREWLGEQQIGGMILLGFLTLLAAFTLVMAALGYT